MKQSPPDRDFALVLSDGY